MEAIHTIMKRRSVRKYLSNQVEWEKVGQILEAGRHAPSAGNLQNWRFIVVSNPANRQAVAEACLRQNWMAQAPVQIVIVSLTDKVTRLYGIRGERLYSIQNCAMAAENMMLAAESLGLGSCFVGAFEETMLKNALSIPDKARPQAIITFGYPDEKPTTPNRYSLENLTFLEFYHEPAGKIKDLEFVRGNYPSAKIMAAIDKGRDLMSKAAEKRDALSEKSQKASHKAIEHLRRMIKKK
jgi:nitroreductase